MRKKIIVVAVAFAVVLGALMLLPVGGEDRSATSDKVTGMDLSSFSASKPDRMLRLLFIHHSVGGQLLAAPGAEQDLADSVHVTHPNGGGLRKALETEGYEVHEASYGSDVGDKTDLFDWLPKFRQKMDKIRKVSFNDQVYGGDERNDIVAFKSCYPNSRFEAMGEAPGKAKGPDLTVWNAKASLAALLEVFKQHPDVLFVYFTAPPNAPKLPREFAGKWLLKKVMGRPSAAEVVAQRASLARTFNNWVKSPEGWLKDYPLKNVVVFDYYDVLTDDGASNLSRYPTDDGSDSHPAGAGQQKAAVAFVPLLNRAVRRAGLSN